MSPKYQTNTIENYLRDSSKMSNVLRIKTHSHWTHVEGKPKAKIFFDVGRSLSFPPSLSFGVNMSLNLIRVKSYRPKKAETVTMCCPAGHASITCPDPSHICTRSTCSVQPDINRLVLKYWNLETLKMTTRHPGNGI